MARPFPYNFISCPCAESPPPTPASNRLSKDLSSLSLKTPDSDEDERTFDPRSRRANYSLYPPEHLLYCEDCHQIKCARCITEEIVCWYCPNCLFETPSSMVRSEGNRYALCTCEKWRYDTKSIFNSDVRATASIVPFAHRH